MHDFDYVSKAKEGLTVMLHPNHREILLVFKDKDLSKKFLDKRISLFNNHHRLFQVLPDWFSKEPSVTQIEDGEYIAIFDGGMVTITIDKDEILADLIVFGYMGIRPELIVHEGEKLIRVMNEGFGHVYALNKRSSYKLEMKQYDNPYRGPYDSYQEFDPYRRHPHRHPTYEELVARDFRYIDGRWYKRPGPMPYGYPNDPPFHPDYPPHACEVPVPHHHHHHGHHDHHAEVCEPPHPFFQYAPPHRCKPDQTDICQPIKVKGEAPGPNTLGIDPRNCACVPEQQARKKAWKK